MDPIDPNSASLSGEVDSHHWPTGGPDGRISVPTARIEPDSAHVTDTGGKLDCKLGAVFQQGVCILSRAGEVLREFRSEVEIASGKPIWSYRSISDLAPYCADEGEARDDPVFALMQTQGPRYLSRPMLRRLSRR